MIFTGTPNTGTPTIAPAVRVMVAPSFNVSRLVPVTVPLVSVKVFIPLTAAPMVTPKDLLTISEFKLFNPPKVTPAVPSLITRLEAVEPFRFALLPLKSARARV